MRGLTLSPQDCFPSGLIVSPARYPFHRIFNRRGGAFSLHPDLHHVHSVWLACFVVRQEFASPRIRERICEYLASIGLKAKTHKSKMHEKIWDIRDPYKKLYKKFPWYNKVKSVCVWALAFVCSIFSTLALLLPCQFAKISWMSSSAVLCWSLRFCIRVAKSYMWGVYVLKQHS